MKPIVFLLMLSFALPLTLKSQNLLGWNKSQVVKNVSNEKGASYVGEYKNDDGFDYVVFSKPTGAYSYYFNEQNVCIEYRILKPAKYLAETLKTFYLICTPVSEHRFIDKKNNLSLIVIPPVDSVDVLTIVVNRAKKTN